MSKEPRRALKNVMVNVTKRKENYWNHKLQFNNTFN